MAENVIGDIVRAATCFRRVRTFMQMTHKFLTQFRQAHLSNDVWATQCLI